MVHHPTMSDFESHIAALFACRACPNVLGQPVTGGKVADLLRNPLHPYTRALLQAIPDADAANAATERDVPPGEPPSLLHPPSGCRFHPRCPLVTPGLCDTLEPPEVEPEPRHLALCWLYKDTKP